MFRFFKDSPASTVKRHASKSRLAVEGLESRALMSATVSLVGHTLTITGDNGVDTVSVTFRDTVDDIEVDSNPLTFTLPNGRTVTKFQADHFSSSQVRNINIDLKGGDDNLSMSLGNVYAPEVGLNGDSAMTLFDAKTMVINLGDGNDEADLHFGGSVAGFANRYIAANLNITVNAGAGNDTVNANFGELQHGTLTYKANLGAGDDHGFAGVWGSIDAGTAAHINLQGQDGNDTLGTFETYASNYDTVNIAAGALLDISVSGGAGNDSLGLTYGGNVLGKLKIREDGGDGSDTIGGDIHLAGVSTGVVDVVYTGDNGTDYMSMELYGAATSTRALIDGGGGIDWATGVGNVQIIHANELRPIYNPVGNLPIAEAP